jgi:hypothetical protein
VPSRQRQIQTTKINNNTFLFKWHQRNSYEKEEDRWYLTKQMKDCVSKANEVDGSEGELETEEEISFRDFNLKDCNK